MTENLAAEFAQALHDEAELLLLGVTGSTAYGLATEQSDVDRLGIYTVATERLFELDFNMSKASVVLTDPDDVQMHEIGKYLGLVLKGNPTVTELLFLDHYEVRDPRVEPLIDMRSKLLGQNTIRASYTGYAIAQAKRLAKFEARKDELDAMPSDLPYEPDRAAAQEFLTQFRISNLS